MELPDSRLVSAAISGDDRAFDALVSRYRSRVYYLALSKVRYEEAARDLAQDAFVRAYLSLPNIREPERFGAWIAAIASNTCNSYLRKPREMPLPAEAIQDLSRDNGEADLMDDEASVARDILYSLPNGTRTAAVLYFAEEMKMTEIAEFLSIPLSAVKSRIRTARSRIKKEMVDMVRQTAKKHEPGDEFNHSLQHRLELARWYRELSELFEIGVPVRIALARLRDADYPDSIREATESLIAAVESGNTMSDALGSLPALVALEAIPMMRAGEVSGTLHWLAAMIADRIEVEEAKQSIELGFWCRVLSTMLDARVPIVEALHRTAEVSRGKALSQATRDWADAVEQRRPVADVLRKYSDVLPPMLRVAILTGESLLAIKLQWAGAQMAEEIFGRVVGGKVEVPVPRSGALEHATAWAPTAIRLLGDEDPGIRAASAEMLGRFKVSSAAEGLLGLLNDPEPAVIKAAIRALVDLGQAPPVEALAARLDMEEPSVRRAAVQALRELGLVSEVSERMAKLLADPDERVSHTAVAALEDAGEITALGNEAVKLVQSGESPELRRKGAAILDKHLFPAPEDLLIAALSDELPEVRYAAARILGHRRDARAVPVIKAAVDACALSQDYLFLADDLEKG